MFEGDTTLLTIRDVATRAKLDKQTVYRLVWSGEIPHYRLGREIRIKECDYREWLSGNRHKGRE